MGLLNNSSSVSVLEADGFALQQLLCFLINSDTGSPCLG